MPATAGTSRGRASSVLVVYTPAAFAAAYLTGGLVAVWVAFAAVFMGARFVVLTQRARGDRWMVTGVVTSRST